MTSRGHRANPNAMNRSVISNTGRQSTSNNIRLKKLKTENKTNSLRTHRTSLGEFLLPKMLRSDSRVTKASENNSNTIRTRKTSVGEFIFSKVSRASSLNHTVISETESAISKNNLTVTRKKDEVAHNCHFFLEDQRTYTIFLKKHEFEFKSPVSLLKRKSGYHGRGKTVFMVLTRGKIQFDIPNVLSADPSYEILPHNITDIKYSGQDQPSFSFDAFIEVPSSKKNKSKTLRNATSGKVFEKFTYKVTCRDNKTAKRWMMYLLLTCENYGDVIGAGLEHLQQTGLVKKSFEHVLCMLKKRVLLYRLSLPEMDTKLLDAKKNLAEHLLYLRRTTESFELFKEIDLDEEIMEQGVAGTISNNDSVSPLESLKMETKYVERLFKL